MDQKKEHHRPLANWSPLENMVDANGPIFLTFEETAKVLRYRFPSDRFYVLSWELVLEPIRGTLAIRIETERVTVRVTDIPYIGHISDATSDIRHAATISMKSAGGILWTTLPEWVCDEFKCPPGLRIARPDLWSSSQLRQCLSKDQEWKQFLSQTLGPDLFAIVKSYHE